MGGWVVVVGVESNFSVQLWSKLKFCFSIQACTWTKLNNNPNVQNRCNGEEGWGNFTGDFTSNDHHDHLLAQSSLLDKDKDTLGGLTYFGILFYFDNQLTKHKKHHKNIK